nr:class I SAM-dependent methyltransferase [Corynebacterium lactis]
MSNAEFWNERFHQDYTAGTPIFAGDPNPTIAGIVEKIGHPGAESTGDPAAGAAEAGPRKTAIDLGSGRGRHVVWLAKNGWDTTGLDFSEVGLEHTRRALEAAGLSAHLVQADLTEWDPEPESFDLVLASFIHLPPTQQSALWQAAARALKPGGHLVSVSHHPDNQIHGPGNPELLYTGESVVEQFAPALKPRPWTGASSSRRGTSRRWILSWSCASSSSAPSFGDLLSSRSREAYAARP